MMKKSVKILIIVLCIAVLGLGGYIVFDKINEKNDQSSSSNASQDNNASKKSEKEEGTNTLNSGDKNVSKEQSNNNSEIKKLNISNENKLKILCYAPSKTFDSVDELSAEDMVYLVYAGLNNDWINIQHGNIEEGLGFAYSESDVKSAVYTIFGVKLNENPSTVGVDYKDGYYYMSFASGDAIPTPVNVESEAAAGTAYYTHDVISYGNVGIYYSGEKYTVGIDSEGFVKSRKLVSNKLYEDINSMQYNLQNPENEENAIVALLKAGKEEFVSEQKNGYFVYNDQFGNSYEIKEITEIGVDFETITSTDGNSYLFKCQIYYTDKDGKDVASNGNVNIIDVALVLSKDLSNYTVHAPYYDYTGSTSFTNNFANF